MIQDQKHQTFPNHHGKHLVVKRPPKCPAGPSLSLKPNFFELPGTAIRLKEAASRLASTPGRAPNPPTSPRL